MKLNINNLPTYVGPHEIKKTIGIIGRTKALELETTDPTFPKRVKIANGRITAFRTQEIIDWIERQNA